MKITSIKKFLFGVVAFTIVLSTLAVPPVPAFAATIAAPQQSNLSVGTCYYNSTVWADLKSFGILISREYLQFDWCWNGSRVTVSRTNHWIQIYYPSTNVTWKNVSVSDGGDGSKIIFAQGEIQFCYFGLCLKKYTYIKIQLLKNGKYIKL